MASRIGEKFGNYRLIRQIGKGGFAEVYLGEHIHMKTRAAIKVLKAQLGDTDKANFLEEARNLFMLSRNHSHIVGILDFGIHSDQTPYLIMDYASGGSLRKKHAYGTPLPLSTVVAYVKQIADALQYAHAHKLIHCDIKPDNMLLSEDGKLLLSDFGIAVIAQSTRYENIQSVQKSIALSIHYASPEQLNGRPRLASDQYSLAVVVYEWLTGSWPFQGDAKSIVIQHQVTSPPSLRLRVPDLPLMTEQVVMKALAKDPHDRFASIQEFVNMLERSLDTRQVSKPPDDAQQSPPVESLPTTVLPNSGVLPRQQVGTQICSYRGHKQAIKAIAWFPQVGRLIASGGSDSQVHFWNAEDGNRAICYEGHENTIRDLAWSSSGEYLASASYDRTVHIWSLRKKEHGFTYRGHFPQFLKQVLWQPQGILVASVDEAGAVHVWDISTGLAAFTGEAQAFAWSPNGDRIVFAKERQGQVWNVKNEIPIQTYGIQDEGMNSVMWSPDGTHIAFSSDRYTQVWNTNSAKRDFILRNVSSVQWSPSGKYIAGIRDDEVIIYHGDTGKECYVYKGHSAYVNSIAWSIDSTRMASASDDSTVQLWNATDGRHRYTYTEHKAAVQCVAWSPDKIHIASFSNGQKLDGSYDERERVIHIWVGA